MSKHPNERELLRHWESLQVVEVEKSTITTAECAAAFLLQNTARDADASITLNRMQALLYRAQGYHLAEYGVPLFHDEIRVVDGIPRVLSLEKKYRKKSERVRNWTGKYPHLRMDRKSSKSIDVFFQLQYGSFLSDIWHTYGALHVEPLHAGVIQNGTGISLLPRKQGSLTLEDIKGDFLAALGRGISGLEPATKNLPTRPIQEMKTHPIERKPMDKTTKKFKKAVAALTEELAVTTPDVNKVDTLLAKARKHLSAGIDPEAQVYFALRTAWDDNCESLPAETAEELRDIAFTYSKALHASTHRKLVAESQSLTRDEELLDCCYDLLMDLNCECYETDYNEDCTAWVNVPTPEEIAVFMSLPTPEGETAKDDREVLVARYSAWLKTGAVSRKFEILE